LQSVASAAIAPMAATAGASNAPTTPNVSGNSATVVLPRVIETLRALPSSTRFLKLSTRSLAWCLYSCMPLLRSCRADCCKCRRALMSAPHPLKLGLGGAQQVGFEAGGFAELRKPLTNLVARQATQALHREVLDGEAGDHAAVGHRAANARPRGIACFGKV